MRLIDADAEITRIEQEIQRIDEKIERLKKLAVKEQCNTFHKFEKELEQCYKNKADCKVEIATLKNYQTYDVDKVVEQLKHTSQDIALLYHSDREPDYEYADGLEVNRAIGIVKAGLEV